MSISAAFSALRGAGRQQLSASTITARPATGSHMFRIDGYMQVRKIMPKDEKTIRSGTFSVGGHDWRLLCYPNGNGKEHEGSHMSLFLEHASHARTGDATAKARLSILDQAWKPCHTLNLSEGRFTRNLGLGDTNGNGLTWGKSGFLKHEDLDVLTKKHLKDDCLTILCDVTVTGLRTEDHVHVEAAAHEPTAVDPPFRMSGQLAEAIWNTKEVDLQIEVGGETLPAHRRILQAGSPVFKADLSLASATPGDTALLRVDDMDADVFKALLRFIYMGSPPVPMEKTMAERLLVAADRYELEMLKPVCEESLCRHVDMSSVAASLALAERHHCSMLRAACMQFLSSPGNLQAFMASDGLEQLRAAAPSALLDLVLKKITIY